MTYHCDFVVGLLPRDPDGFGPWHRDETCGRALIWWTDDEGPPAPTCPVHGRRELTVTVVPDGHGAGADALRVGALMTPLINGAKQTGTTLCTDGWRRVVRTDAGDPEGAAMHAPAAEDGRDRPWDVRGD